MSTAKTLVDAGRLTDAVAELTNEVKTRPSDGRLRVFLFELLCFQGDFARAGKQLDVLATQSVSAGEELAVQAYHGLLAAEGRRREVFHGSALPKFILPPPAHVERLVLSVKKLDSAPDDALALLEQAEDLAPAVTGSRTGGQFASFRDADDRMSSVLEVFHGTEYLWVPIDQIVSLDILPPRKLRDLMWAQAKLEVAGQPEGDVFVPALYVDTARHDNEQVRLGRQTEWNSLQDRAVTGTGQRVFLIDGEDVPLFDLGRVTFASPVVAAEPQS